jgi:hypothetical protein
MDYVTPLQGVSSIRQFGSIRLIRQERMRGSVYGDRFHHGFCRVMVSPPLVVVGDKGTVRVLRQKFALEECYWVPRLCSV